MNRVSAAAVFALGLLVLSGIARASGQDNPYPYPRSCNYPISDINQNSDEILAFWRHQPKFYLVMGAVNTATKGPGAASAAQEFALADVDSLVSILRDQGYQPIPNAKFRSKIVGPDAIEANLKEEIGHLQDLGDDVLDNDPLVLFYYSGHGQVGGQFSRLKLWPSGPDLNDDSSIEFSHILQLIRNHYKGRLVVLLDTCYSGQALKEISASDLDSDTAILASSSLSEQSSATCSNGKLQSAFTCALTQLLQGSDPASCKSKSPPALSVCGWDDGIAPIGPLHEVLFRRLKAMDKPEPQYKPFGVKGSTSDPRGMLAYFCEAVTNPNSNGRQVIHQTAAIRSAIAAVRSAVATGNSVFGLGLQWGDVLAIRDKNDKVLGVLTVEAPAHHGFDVAVSAVSTLALEYERGEVREPARSTYKDGQLVPGSERATPQLTITVNNASNQQVPIPLTEDKSNAVVEGLAAQFAQVREGEDSGPLTVRDLKKIVKGEKQSPPTNTMLLGNQSAADYLLTNLPAFPGLGASQSPSPVPPK